MKKKGFIYNRIISLMSYVKKCPSKMILFFVFIYLFVSIALYLYTNNNNWVSASGGVLTILGVLVVFATSTPITIEEIQTHASQNDSISYWAGNEESTLKAQQQALKNSNDLQSRQVLALTITIIGTFVWAYGWLLP